MEFFVTAARELNFSRTALLMNMEQSTLSKRISMLEQILGVKLFIRDSGPFPLRRRESF
jgi:DNA-binding transcriptional LysR family regulator